MEVLTMIFSIISLLVGLPAIVVSVYTLIELKAMKKSTHKIEYMPVPVPEVSIKQDREFKETLNEDHLESFIL